MGALGEMLARQYLTEHNFAIIAQNYKCPLGEIDLIAREGETMVFVEVKSQYAHVTIRPERKVDARKQKKLIRLARYYRHHHLTPNTLCRIDVITVILSSENKPDRITHYKHAI